MTTPAKRDNIILILLPLIPGLLTVLSAVFHSNFGAYSTVVLGGVTGLAAIGSALAHAHLRAPLSLAAIRADLADLTRIVPAAVREIETLLADLHGVHPATGNSTPVTVAPRVAGKLGRLPVKPPAKRLQIRYLHEYAPSLPAPVYPIDASGGISDFGMLGNDRYGDCGVAGRLHYDMTTAAAVGQTVPHFATGQAVSEYLTFTGGQDTGVNLADYLLWLYGRGEILAFAPVDVGDRAKADAALQAFHGLYTGVALTPDAQAQFAAGQPWDGTNPDPRLGHCILQVIATGSEDGWVTWGALQRSTSDWTASCRDEAWVVITREEQIDPAALAALKADIAALAV